ncbi:RNA polymerase ECF-type sigma factor [Plesiocystis pacifica SIR-1]|uniref:RNA polymerase ECF-type sigma factor n=1 Tax=Plesiocystis pacifica SIR-1 TaxID=391625 RepID=A6GDS3_9BACT|nr:sigma-70 family RNA polymerase sigma factor [Plesiocystis pacifica]EDM75962.1 RNA polymerase ECF-type sigma factor [Plesiocystis pacifica SIR-1]
MAPATRKTDRELLDAWTRGDVQAASELFERHFDAIDRFFRNKVVDGYEDLVQQTFQACVESRDRFRGDASFRTFLFGIANNVLKAFFRSRRRERDRFEFTEVSACDVAPGPSTMFRARREQQLLLEALRRIPLDYQIVLELYYWEELPGSAIAEVVNLPENTVRSRIRKGKALLEKKMKVLARNPEELQSTLGDLETWARSIHAKGE